MVIVLEKGIPQHEKDGLKDFLIRNNFKVNEINGDEETIMGAVMFVDTFYLLCNVMD